MKKLKYVCIKIAVLAAVFGAPNLANAQWYANGTLHKATVGQWKFASYRNKLATAADWAAQTSEAKRAVESSGKFSTLRPYAANLVTCVNEAAAGQGYETMRASEVAATCAVLMGWHK